MDDIKIEAIAQVSYLKDFGINISHFDSHGHLHKYPQISNKLSENESIYSGLFYTGSEALSLGLIDGLSSLYDLKSDRYDNLPIQKYNRDNDILNQILKTSFHYLSQLNLN